MPRLLCLAPLAFVPDHSLSERGWVSSEEVAGPKPSLEGYGGVEPSQDEGFAPAHPCTALLFIEHLL